MKKLYSLFLLAIFFSTPAYCAFTLSNFNTPESFIVDPEDGSYYVSNINGDFLAKDGNGYISKINSKGTLVIQKFIGDKPGVLDAPKGLAIVGKNLYVTDIDQVKVFSKDSRRRVALIDFTKFDAKFLNDICSDGAGNLYVSDMMTNTIFKIEPKKQFATSIFKKSKELSSPNGLFFNPRSKNLMVVTWDPGTLLEIDRNLKIHILKRGLKNLDGISSDKEGNLYISSFEMGEIYKVTLFGRGYLSTYLSGLTTPADISYDSKLNEILIPSFKGNTITVMPLQKELPKK